MYCPQCGKKLIKDTQKFCISCGSSLLQNSLTLSLGSKNFFLPKRIQGFADLKQWFSLIAILIFVLGVLYLYGWFTGIFDLVKGRFTYFLRFVILPGSFLAAAAYFRSRNPKLTLSFGALAGLLQVAFLVAIDYEYLRGSGKAFETLNFMFNPFYPGHGTYLVDRFSSFVNFAVVFISPILMMLSGVYNLKDSSARKY